MGGGCSTGGADLGGEVAVAEEAKKEELGVAVEAEKGVGVPLEGVLGAQVKGRQRVVRVQPGANWGGGGNTASNGPEPPDRTGSSRLQRPTANGSVLFSLFFWWGGGWPRYSNIRGEFGHRAEPTDKLPTPTPSPRGFPRLSEPNSLDARADEWESLARFARHHRGRVQLVEPELLWERGPPRVLHLRSGVG